MLDELVYEIQRLYPQIYLACHTDHVRASSTDRRLSSHDASILAHLELSKGVSPGALANHLGIVPSTLSASLKRLTRLGYVRITPVSSDRRRREMWLTKQGAEAMAETSILDSARVRQMLERLSAGERKSAVGGLALLARAARALKEEG